MSSRFAVPLLLCSLAAHPAAAQVVRQLTDVKTTVAGFGALDDAGTAVWVGASIDLGANPRHTFQVVRFDPATGAASAVTAAEDGAAALVSVSDDGQWLAFPSPADLTGQNHDRSIELFVMRTDGTSVQQLTDDPAVNAGSLSAAVISGNGARVAFLANTNPLGTNPANRTQLFVVDRTGANLRQLTSFAEGSVGGVAISDDATRIVFAHDGDPLGLNADRGGEVFAVNADGTGLRQLTVTAATYASGAPSLAGNGSKVAFESSGDLVPGSNLLHQVEIFVVDWAGTGLRQLTRTTAVLGIAGDPASQSPSITDDGAWVFYHSNHSVLFPPVNFDGNFEIFKIRSDGTGRTALTSSILDVGSLLPTVSGSGTRVSYLDIGTSVALAVMDGAGGSKRSLLAYDLVFNGSPAVTPDGSRIVFVRSAGLFSAGEIWRVASDGSDLAQVTSLGSGSPASPSIAADGVTIAFSAGSNPTGGNSDGSDEIFTVRADGTGLAQLTSGPSGTASSRPALAAEAPVVVFDSDADLLGTNADGSVEVFVVGLDGGGLRQLTAGVAGTESRSARVDATGTWIVFESNADLDGGNPDGTYEVWRARADGTVLERITGSATLDAGSPDIAGDGSRVVFSTSADLVGANPEGNPEIYAWSAATGTFVQLTSSVEGASGGPRLSGDGAWATFSSDAPFFEVDPDRPSDIYRVPATGGAVERIGGLRAGSIGGVPILGGGSTGAQPDRSATVAPFSGIGDFTEGNPDLLPEVWTIDLTTAPSFDVGRASPTVLAWTVQSGPVRYDVIRGDVASLGVSAGVVDLGPVSCLEDDSPDADTRGFGDPDEPAPGQCFFFLYRGSPGSLAGPGSYGRGTGGLERVPGPGDCDAF